MHGESSLKKKMLFELVEYVKGWCNRWHRLYNIYIQIGKSRYIPVTWPDSFAEFKRTVDDLFPSFSGRDTIFMFEDGTGHRVFVKDERSFKALVPKMSIIGETKIFYLVLFIKYQKAGAALT